MLNEVDFSTILNACLLFILVLLAAMLEDSRAKWENRGQSSVVRDALYSLQHIVESY